MKLRYRQWQAALMAASLVMTTPARADKVICDGNFLCLAAVVPVMLVGVAISELNKPRESRAEMLIRSGDSERLAKLIAAHPDLISDAANSQVLALAASRAGSVAAMEVLVKAGVSPRADRSRVLSVATTPELMRYLLANGAVADEVHLSAMQGNMGHPRLHELLAVLLDARSKPLDRNDAGAINLLNTAAGQERVDVVKLLLERGVNPNGDAYQVPLLTAARACAGRAATCQARAAAIARELIASGANVKAVDTTTRRTALQTARLMQYTALVTLLEEAGG